MSKFNGGGTNIGGGTTVEGGGTGISDTGGGAHSVRDRGAQGEMRQLLRRGGGTNAPVIKW